MAAITPVDGYFETTIELPAGEGWESESEAIVVAYTADFTVSAVAEFTIEEPSPGPTQEAPAAPPSLGVMPSQVTVGSTMTVSGKVRVKTTAGTVSMGPYVLAMRRDSRQTRIGLP